MTIFSETIQHKKLIKKDKPWDLHYCFRYLSVNKLCNKKRIQDKSLRLTLYVAKKMAAPATRTTGPKDFELVPSMYASKATPVSQMMTATIF